MLVLACTVHENGQRQTGGPHSRLRCINMPLTYSATHAAEFKIAGVTFDQRQVRAGVACSPIAGGVWTMVDADVWFAAPSRSLHIPSLAWRAHSIWVTELWPCSTVLTVQPAPLGCTEQAALQRLGAQQAVMMVREPWNQYDPSAVAVYTLSGESLGFVPRAGKQPHPNAPASMGADDGGSLPCCLWLVRARINT